jgi:hypothetical protein
MKSLLQQPTELELLPDFAKPFTVMVAFDDCLARRKATQIYSNLVKQFGEDFVFESDWRPFDDLRRPDVAEQAARMAGRADLVMVVAAARDELPDHIKLWIEMWLARKGDQETALVAMIGVPEKQPRPVTPAHAYLERVAQQTGLSFLPGQFEVPRPIPSCSLEALLARAEAFTPVLEEILHHPPPPRWGINE